MTEAEWLAGTVNRELFEFLGDGPSERKYRLFSAACCRRLLAIEPDFVGPAVAAVEGRADGTVSKRALQAVRTAAGKARYRPTLHQRQIGGAVYAATWAEATPNCPAWARAGHASEAAAHAVKPHGEHGPGEVHAERAFHRSALRDIVGNPFRRVAADPGWLTETVRALAAGIYSDQAFDRLPILADALMDAGCADERLLGHCRDSGPHVRGCWVVDLVLGQE